MSDAAGDYNWNGLIRKDHPRLFFNRDTWPAVKARALGEEAAAFAAMRSRVDILLQKDIERADYGSPAAEAAFVFRVTGDRGYLDLAHRLLDQSVRFYDWCYEQKREVSWYSFSRVNALAAYDWLYNDLEPAERKRIGAALLIDVRREQPTRDRKPFSPRENWLPPISGFYSTPSLVWYAGVATFGEGFDDALSAKFVEEGYRLFVQLLRYRGNAASDDGGSASGALNYSLAAYPWAEFNFFHTFKSATGRDIAREWPYVAYLPGYIFWNWLPEDGEFGYGDAYHTRNKMPLGELHSHLSHIIQFYAESYPECASFAQWLLQKTPRNERSTFAFTRFLLTSMPDVKPAQDPAARMPLARHFENMGQIFFRSGSGPDDTYALFTAGGVLEMHKQFDLNNFVIYKKGFLALDSGTRPEPGQHLSHYYARTVAHNCILIHMPGEEMPRYWGYLAPGEEKLPYPNDGGQRNFRGSRVVAFETGKEFAYIASDATKAYSDKKCKLALRQFVFLPPDHFIVFDRVISTDPSFKKTWLLHTAKEPFIKGPQFTAEHEQGRIYCRTLLPQKAELGKIGGPGKQFWSDGRNWPLPKGSRTQDTEPLLGQWRVEVSPAKAETDDLFLHLIQVGEAKLDGMVKSKLLREGNRAGVRFDYNGGRWEVLFGTEGDASGHIRLRRAGKLVLNRDLTREVQKQAGIYGEGPAR